MISFLSFKEYCYIETVFVTFVAFVTGESSMYRTDTVNHSIDFFYRTVKKLTAQVVPNCWLHKL